jgi:LytS/YehU family sensor histidine kinase
VARRASVEVVTPGTLLIELAEKMSLLAAAALVAVLFPPLRNRLLGVGRRADKAAGMVLGIALAIWGSMLGITIDGEHINVRAIGVIIAAILGGRKAGALAGLVGGLFSAARADDQSAPFVVVASVLDGVLAGIVAKRSPHLFQGWRAFVTSFGIQTVHLVVVGLALIIIGHAERYIPAWPAHLVKLIVNAAGVTLFVVVARLVVAREEAAVALVEARSLADAAALEALRSKLEPHFLFNALNALRATIRKDPVRARELVSDLADLYRYLLSHPHEATVRDEVAHACAYLAIERARLGDERLAVRQSIDADAAGIAVPALLLQPLVENAVKHGVAAREGAGEVVVRARVEEGQLVLEVEDATDGAAEPGRTTLDETGAGIALATLRERLVKQFGARASLELVPTERGTIARVSLPAVTAVPTETAATDAAKDAA